MKKIEIQVQRCPGNEDTPMPQYMTVGAAGADLYAAVQEPLVIAPGAVAAIPTGIKIALPAGFEAQIRPRSGLALKHGVTLLNTPGTIDADYRGEIQLIIINHGSRPFTVNRGERMAQMVIQKVWQGVFREIVELEDTSRGEGGFGSTGI